jgi:hypothetical protein
MARGDDGGVKSKVPEDEGASTRLGRLGSGEEAADSCRRPYVRIGLASVLPERRVHV